MPTELSTDLVIKIVVLLTAIIGLYKTANIEIAKPFLVQIYAAVAVLIVPAMMLGFLWITNATIHIMDRPKDAVSYDGPDAEVMYKISREFWDQKMRQEALALVIERAFQTKEWAVIVKASEDLNPTSQRDPILLRAVKLLAGPNNTPTDGPK
jgi:hypothetical protein